MRFLLAPLLLSVSCSTSFLSALEGETIIGERPSPCRLPERQSSRQADRLEDAAKDRLSDVQISSETKGESKRRQSYYHTETDMKSTPDFSPYIFKRYDQEIFRSLNTGKSSGKTSNSVTIDTYKIEDYVKIPKARLTSSLNNIPINRVKFSKEDILSRSHNEDIKELRESLIAYGLTRAEVIELYLHMSDEQFQFYAKSPRPSLDEVKKPELKIIKNRVESLLKENEPYIITHYSQYFATTGTITNLLKGLQSVSEKNNEKIIEMATSEKNKKLADLFFSKPKFKERHPNVDLYTVQLNLAKSIWITENYLEGVEEFVHFRKQLRGLLSRQHLRSQVYSDIAAKIFEYLMNFNELLEDWEFMEIDRSKEEIKILPFQKLGVLEAHNSGGLYLALIINELVQKGIIHDVTAISEDNILLIHNEVHRLRLEKTIYYDSFLVTKEHLTEVLQYKNSIPYYDDRLFYSYAELVDLILEGNRKIIEKIKKQPKRNYVTRFSSLLRDLLSDKMVILSA